MSILTNYVKKTQQDLRLRTINKRKIYSIILDIKVEFF